MRNWGKLILSYHRSAGRATTDDGTEWVGHEIAKCGIGGKCLTTNIVSKTSRRDDDDESYLLKFI